MVYTTLLIALFKWVAKKKGISPNTVEKAIKALSDPAVKELVGIAMKKITTNLARRFGNTPVSTQALQNAIITPAISSVLKQTGVAGLTIKKALKGLSKKSGLDYFITQVAKMIKKLGNRAIKNPAKGLKFDITILKNPPKNAPVKKKKKVVKKNPIASLVFNPRKKKGINYKGLSKVKVFALRRSKSVKTNPAKRVPAKLTKKTVAEIKAGNKAAGRHYFSADTMKFFKSKIHPTVFYIGGVNYLIDSTQMTWVGSERPRKYSILKVNPDYTIVKIGENEQYSTLNDAKEGIKAIKLRVEGSKKKAAPKKKSAVKKEVVANLKRKTTVSSRKKIVKKVTKKKSKKNPPKEYLIYPQIISITVIKAGKKKEFNCKDAKIKIMGCKDGSIVLRGFGAGAIPANNCKVTQIKAKKGTDSLWPNQLFKHDFKVEPILIVQNASTVKIKGSKPLHKLFSY